MMFRYVAFSCMLLPTRQVTNTFVNLMHVVAAQISFSHPSDSGGMQLRPCWEQCDGDESFERREIVSELENPA